ncbi:MAG TPA: tRNA (adenosine(37)-N6)-threonylcarbamoyltransferase complex ATPase subunit type 1 TsaE [Candidatus Kapabacteria bacterium]|nr:tRNA (adenosine(37)-N6)-threonylcarbamoyltransferase complex ATPase subunit type 1 TsaE [Candidatus Kapabacteria bacterium]
MSIDTHTREVARQVSRSEEETVRLGEEFGREFVKAGVVVVVRGELGAGKTHFVKGVARSLGLSERELTSPTFSLANEYEIPGENFRLFHLDCYRFERPEELLELGVEDYLYPQNAATIVEWPERIERFIPKGAIEVELRALSETEREIIIRLNHDLGGLRD